jgi:hypothetical protein
VLYIPQHRLCIVRQKAFGAPSGAAIGSHVLRATPHFVCRSYLSRKLNRPPAQSFFAAFARIFIARYLAAPPSLVVLRFLSDRGLHHVRERMDHRAVGDADAGADHHERLDGDVAAEGGIGSERDRLRPKTLGISVTAHLTCRRRSAIECTVTAIRRHYTNKTGRPTHLNPKSRCGDFRKATNSPPWALRDSSILRCTEVRSDTICSSV